MSENTVNQAAAPKLQASETFQRWRLFKDIAARYTVVVGGLGVIGAIVLIFFYLLYVVIPLFAPASVSSIAQYEVPEKALGRTVLLELEEQNEMAVRFTDTGRIIFFNAIDGKPQLEHALKIPENAKISSFARSSQGSQGGAVYGFSNGSAVILQTDYKASYAGKQRQTVPALSYPLGEQPLSISPNGQPLEHIAVTMSEEATTVAAKAGNKIYLVRLNKEQGLLNDTPSLQRTDATIDIAEDEIAGIHLDKENRYLYLAWQNGLIKIYDIAAAEPVLKHQMDTMEKEGKLTALAFLNGDLSILIGDSSGQVSQWTQIRADNKPAELVKLRSFNVSGQPIQVVEAEQRRKGFLAIDAVGKISLNNSTAEREVINAQLIDSAPLAAALSPRSNRLLLERAEGKLNFWQVDNEHPEVSLKSLWQKCWYESYPKPAYIWQSTSANNDFEPKYSLTPLVFGTLKAAFYAMLVAMPLALMGAIYTAYFMAPAMRQLVKPVIELMGALPTVIIGFLAGLWLAPFVEKNLAGILLVLFFLPTAVLSFSFCWQLLPETLRQKVPEGWEGALLVPVIILAGASAFLLANPLEALAFNGSLRDWLSQKLGIGYDQRNALIVGIAMGFAVIPSIFTIAEDAIFSVPKHLTIGSLALGATTWQTLMRVVLLTASPGIFSAVMIGLGRAIGETMIVLMATGNTPVMDFSVFQGLRTLAANVAVEMPESEVDSTHYRVLFLAALVLFLFTFILNTLAEVIRQRLREKYSSL